jgi:hypothetical protein
MGRRRRQRQLFAWYEASVRLAEKDPLVRTELEEWEAEHLDGYSVGTSDWPGWAQLIGPRPT